jgi:hypothetical protein
VIELFSRILHCILHLFLTQALNSRKLVPVVMAWFHWLGTTPRNTPNIAKVRLWSMSRGRSSWCYTWGGIYITVALSDVKYRPRISMLETFISDLNIHAANQRFTIEPSFICFAIRGCANLPQNRKTINYEDINYTSEFCQQYIIAMLVVRYTSLGWTSFYCFRYHW